MGESRGENRGSAAARNQGLSISDVEKGPKEQVMWLFVKRVPTHRELTPRAKARWERSRWRGGKARWPCGWS